MSIPLDRLYHYIKTTAEQIYNDSLIIYLFLPHGSKNINDLTTLNDNPPEHLITKPLLYCYDQEALNYDLYKNIPVQQTKLESLIAKYQLDIPKYNFQCSRQNIYDKSLLLHSEKRSSELEKYQHNWFIPVYYWSHAIIARDWFRYAQYIDKHKKTTKIFLIYNRAWAGTREYRLKFAELLAVSGVDSQCHTHVNVVEPELKIHYKDHKFNNQIWKPESNLENYFKSKNVPGHCSADFDINDYNTTDIEIVLETLFDDSRLHLTEKSLRPIACAQPFILLGTHGSLEYLRSYGFQTFDSVWNEHYDTIQDPLLRLQAVIAVMKEITNWDNHTRSVKLLQAQKIAEYNKNHFFSSTFFNNILNEFQSNLKSGLEELENTNTSRLFFERRKKLYSVPEISEHLWSYQVDPDANWNDRTRQQMLYTVSKARKYYIRNLNQK
jgi:hypothetical protein